MDITVLEDYLELLNKYGWPAVFFLFGLFVWFIPWIKELKYNSEAKKMIESTDSVSDIIELEKDLTIILGQIANTIKCQWAVIWQFHNGSVSLGKIPFIKMSVTNEYNVAEVNSRGQLYQDLPISLFTDALDVINDKGVLKVNVTGTKYSTITSAYKSDGISCGYFTRLTNAKGKFIGVLSVSFLKDIDLSNDKIIALTGFASRISMCLVKVASGTKVVRSGRRIDDWKC